MKRLAEETIINCFLQIRKNEKIAFLSCWLIGIVAHGYIFTNRIMYHDDAGANSNLGSTITSERYTLELIQRVVRKISQNATTSWLHGILALTFIALSVVLVVRLLDIHSIISSILIAGVMVSIPAVAATYAYMFTAPAYFGAMFCSILAVLLADKMRCVNILLSGLLLATSLGIYQAYISVFVVLVLLLMIKYLLDGSRKKSLSS